MFWVLQFSFLIFFVLNNTFPILKLEIKIFRINLKAYLYKKI